jgi:DNA/RNA-binding domain of Phe-tRNA-synthetase-like protein
MDELDLRDGWVEPDLAEEFPELGVVYAPVEARPARKTPPSVKDRLRTLSNRFTGGKVVHMRQESVPWAYRVFFRQVGIDPDSHRTPVEQAALDRMKWGGFRSTNLVDDALLIATIETGVPVIAFDGDRVGVAIGMRLSEPGELLGGSGRPLSDRQIVVADEERSLAVLFDEVAEERGVSWATERMVLAALEVKGVPRICVDEALWMASEVLQTKE